jgi:ABC-type phosphate transport system permease subunit
MSVTLSSPSGGGFVKALLAFLPVVVLVSLVFQIVGAVLHSRGMTSAGAGVGVLLASNVSGRIYFRAEGRRPGVARAILFALSVIFLAIAIMVGLWWATEVFVYHRDAGEQGRRLLQELVDAYNAKPGPVGGLFGGLFLFFTLVIALMFNFNARAKS